MLTLVSILWKHVRRLLLLPAVVTAMLLGVLLLR
jgi:hypothetical protein